MFPSVSSISKVIENVVSIGLKSHLFTNHLNEPLQSAYRQYHSIETALVHVLKDVFLELDISLV